MILRSPTDKEIALTLALSHQNGRGNSSIQEAPNMNPRSLAGEGRVRVLCPPSTVFSKEDAKSRKFRVSIIQKLRVFCALCGEQSKLNLAHYLHKSPKNLKIKKFCRWDFEFGLELRKRIHGVA